MKRGQEDHFSQRGYNSITHHNLVHKPTLIPQAMKIPDAKAAIDEEWDKSKKLPAWQEAKVKSNKEFFEQTHEEKILFILLGSWTMSSNFFELEKKFQQYRGLVVSCGDVVKDDSGTYAVFY